MSDAPFQRPGSEARPATRPQHTCPPSADGQGRTTPPAAPASADAPSPRRAHSPRLRLAIGLAGFVVGGLAAAALSALYFAEPQPLPITVDAFPKYILGLQRMDIKDGSEVTTSEVEADVAQQLDHFRFAYGGDGAAVDYESGLTLTIVNGRLTPGLPNEPRDEYGAGSLRLISLDTADVKCVFVPVVGLYEGAVLDTQSDLKASGLTDCTLVDAERNLSLRLVNHTDNVRGDALEAATRFAAVLERTHADLVD